MLVGYDVDNVTVSSCTQIKENPSEYEGVLKLRYTPLFVCLVCGIDMTTNDDRIVYLGKFDKEENAARAHDLVALKFGGPSTKTNFPKSDYKGALEAMASMTKTEVVAAIRRLSDSFVRSISKYHGVFRHAYTGKWQARILGPGTNCLLGTFNTEEEAARAYDIKRIRKSGQRAFTNFDISSYNVDAILSGQTDKQAIMHCSKEVKALVEPLKLLEISQNNTEPIIREEVREVGITMGSSGPNQQQACDHGNPSLKLFEILENNTESIIRQEEENREVGIKIASSGPIQQEDSHHGEPILALSHALKSPPLPLLLHAKLSNQNKRKEEGEGCSCMVFKHASTSAFKQYKKSCSFNHAKSSAFRDFKRRKVVGETSK